MRRIHVVILVSGVGLIAACVGGPGDTPGFEGGYENRRGSFEAPPRGPEAPRYDRERPPTVTERPPLAGVEPAPGPGGSGGAIDCSGTYDCTIRGGGQSGTDDVQLRERDGVCTVDGAVVLAPNGEVRTTNGRVVGSWSGSGTSFTFSIATEEGSASGTCTRRAGGGGGGGGGGEIPPAQPDVPDIPQDGDAI
jgi:hypothetical protein